MPGEWDEASRLLACNAAAAFLRGRGPAPGASPVTAQAAEPLVQSVDLASCLSVVDPFGEYGAVSAGLVTAGIGVITGAQVAPSPFNPLSHASYEHLSQQAPIEAIVSAPWPSLLDLTLPLFTSHATRMVCCLVPVAFVTNAHAPRRAWLRKLQQEDRLLFVHLQQPLQDQQGTTISYMWLVIFSSAAVRKSSTRLYGTGSVIL